jgi:hypothetical protein
MGKLDYTVCSLEMLNSLVFSIVFFE